ncbi:Putative basic-leucine zipper domain-containing protein [Septoria linicola]|uniref:Basic-leucine zipper domain-containing protein n=1 Tax=Septoria linicola TaxID=215465 RepID=A0A9Q9ESG8_9PEZI|nr:putative basic-leucine zipper domain-containing protein [Septoria linicola]USW59583.1 Putative basic-leucine zipper domain-containing protein [Septoria linicola]
MDVTWIDINESNRCPDLFSNYMAGSSLSDLPSFGRASAELQFSHDFIQYHGYDETAPDMSAEYADPTTNWNNNVPQKDVTTGATQSPGVVRTGSSEADDNMALESLDYMSPSKEPRTTLGLCSLAELQTTPDVHSVAPVSWGTNTSAVLVGGAISEDDPTTVVGHQEKRSDDRASLPEQHISTIRERNRRAATKCRARKTRESARLVQDEKVLGQRNATLRQEMNDLKAKRAELRSLILDYQLAKLSKPVSLRARETKE